MKLLLMLLVLVAVSGCAAVNEKIVQGVSIYCTEPHSERMLIRELVNADLTALGHRIEVHCDGDPE